MSSSDDDDEDERSLAYAPRVFVEDEPLGRVRKLPTKNKATGNVISPDDMLAKPLVKPVKKASIPLVYDEEEDKPTEDVEIEQQEEEEEEVPQESIEEQLRALARYSTSILAFEKNAIKTSGVSTNAKGEAVAPEKSDLDKLLHVAKTCKVWKVRKFALVSLLAVFKDVLPDEYVRELTQQELQNKSTKDTREMRAQERIIMSAYRTYVTLLLGMKEETSLYCLCHLFEYRGMQFNYADEILSRMLSVSSPLCLESIQRVMKEDLTFETTLSLLKRIGRMYEKKGYRALTADVLALFQNLKLTLDLKDEKRLNEIHKAKKFRKDKKRKIGPDLTKLLQETDSTSRLNHESHERQLELIRELFTLYLRILTCKHMTLMPLRKSKLVSQALLGARRLVNLVNVELVHGLVQLLAGFQFLEDDPMAGAESMCNMALETCETGLVALSILSKPELRQHHVECHEVFFQTLLQRVLRSQVLGRQHVNQMVQCVSLLFLRRRENDVRTVHLFALDLLQHVIFQQEPSVKMAFITLVRNLVEKYPSLGELLHGSSSSSSSGAVREVACCGPLIPVSGKTQEDARMAWEWDLLASSYHLAVKRSASEARVGKPTLQKPLEALQFDSLQGKIFHPLVLPELRKKSPATTTKSNRR